MPTDLVKQKAEEHDISVEEAEEKWKKAKEVVKDQYDLDEDDDEFWALVNGVFSNMLGEKIKIINNKHNNKVKITKIT